MRRFNLFIFSFYCKLIRSISFQLSPDPQARSRKMPQAVSENTPHLSEILDLIVDELGDPDVRAKVAGVIKDSFRFFRFYDQWFARAGKAALAENAKEIADGIAALESKLAASGPLTDFLFTPLWARGTVITREILSAITDYREDTFERLRRMRSDCERLRGDHVKETKKHPLRHGPEIDRAQRHCAILAYGLMANFSKKPITGSAQGSYHCVASLLFEALTGRTEVDLKRHCDFVREAPHHFTVGPKVQVAHADAANLSLT